MPPVRTKIIFLMKRRLNAAELSPGSTAAFLMDDIGRSSHSGDRASVLDSSGDGELVFRRWVTQPTGTRFRRHPDRLSQKKVRSRSWLTTRPGSPRTTARRSCARPDPGRLHTAVAVTSP